MCTFQSVRCATLYKPAQAAVVDELTTGQSLMKCVLFTFVVYFVLLTIC